MSDTEGMASRREIIDSQGGLGPSMSHRILDELEAAQAENAKLREALEKIEKYPHSSMDTWVALGYNSALSEVQVIAREALHPHPQEAR